MSTLLDKINIEIPHKKSKKRPLNKAQKQENRTISKVRVVIENIFANIKKGNYPRMYLWRKEMKLNEFNNSFQTEKHCLKYIASLKLMKCIKCGSTCLNVSDLRRMRCLKCHQTFSILHGTIFYKSQTQLTSWFYLIFRWINNKHGIPATDVAKELGVTYKTAWRMGHEIRTRIAKQEPQFIATGISQMDEMYLSHMGSKQQGRSLLNKTLIVGIYEKTANTLIVKVLKKADKKTFWSLLCNTFLSTVVYLLILEEDIEVLKLLIQNMKQ